MLILPTVRNWTRKPAAALALSTMLAAMSGCSAAGASAEAQPRVALAQASVQHASKRHPFSFAHYTMVAPPSQGAGWVSSNR